jgi:hypothetical protein
LTSFVDASVKVVFGHHPEMMEIDPATAAAVPGNFVHNAFLPYHDGAAPQHGTRLRPASSWGD